nr:hypothetical protein [uncultured Flavobacterium sp.]
MLLLILGITVSCKNDKQAEGAAAEGTTAVNPNFNVELTLFASKIDDLAMYFIEDNTAEFNSDNVCWATLDAQNQDTKVKFEIQEGRMPTRIRLDFGHREQEDSVVVKNVKVNYLEKSFEIKGSEFFTYFNRDDQFKTRIDSVNGTLVVYKTAPEFKTPFFYSGDVLDKKIGELTGVVK